MVGTGWKWGEGMWAACAHPKAPCHTSCGGNTPGVQMWKPRGSWRGAGQDPERQLEVAFRVQ